MKARDEKEVSSEIKSKGTDCEEKNVNGVKANKVHKLITDYLTANPSGLTLLEITDFLKLHLKELQHTKESVGRGSMKRIVLGTLNSSKAFEQQVNPKSGVNVWKLKQLIDTPEETKSTPKKTRVRKIPLSTLESNIKIPKKTKAKAECREILCLLERTYERLKPDIGDYIEKVNVNFY